MVNAAIYILCFAAAMLEALGRSKISGAEKTKAAEDISLAASYASLYPIQNSTLN
jgi:hypothetical protein